MSTGLMVTEGTCDAKKRLYVQGKLERPDEEGPGQGTVTTRWTSPTAEVFEMYTPGRMARK